MKPRVKAYIVSIVQYLFSGFICWIISLLLKEPLDMGNVAAVFAILVAVDYYTDKFSNKRNEL